MLIDFLVALVDRVATDAVVAAFTRMGRSARDAVSEPEPEPEVVSAYVLTERRYAYAQWAKKHGFEPDERRANVFVAERLGFRIRFTTGVSERPRSPEFEIAHPSSNLAAVLVLRRGEGVADATVAGRYASVLACEGVRDIAITKTLVRLRFDPLEHPSCFDEALDVLLRTLTTKPSSAYR